MKEVWKEIEGYEGLYQISNKGRIKTTKRQGSKGGFKNYRIGDTGYYLVWLSKEQKAKEYKVHRLVAQSFIPNPENKPFVCHKKGNKLDLCTKDLYWGTPSENIADKIRHGTSQHGERNAGAVLTERQVIAVKVLYERIKSPRDVSALLGISIGNVNAIIYGYNWKEV